MRSLLLDPVGAAPEGDRSLLCAALHPDLDRARDAWARARTLVDFDQPTSEQYRLFPLVAGRVSHLAPGDPLGGMLRGVARQQTVSNLVRLREVAVPVSMLVAADIGVAVLKGPALAVTAYDQVGLRPFVDADLLVHPDDHRRALSVLTGAGWRTHSSDFAGNHAVPLDGDPIDVDLHRYANREMVTPGDPRSAWNALELVPGAVDLGRGRRVATLAPADQLVHAIVHGTQLVREPLSRWIADVTVLIDRGIEWDRVVTLARAFRIGAVIAGGLREVASTTGAMVPQPAFDRLDDLTGSAFDRLRMRAFRMRPCPTGRLGGLPLTLTLHLQRTRHRSAVGVVADAPRFLRHVWGANGWSDLAGVAGRRAWRSLGPTPDASIDGEHVAIEREVASG